MGRIGDNRVCVHGRALLAMIHDRLRRRRVPARLRVRAGQDPTSLISSPHDAIVVAEGLLGSVPRRQVSDEFWQTVAAGPLSALLYAASPRGNRAGIGWVDLAVDNLDANSGAPGWYQAAEICRAAGAASSGDNLLARLIINHLRGPLSSRQQVSICYAMRAAIAPWLLRDPINGVAAPRAS
jgi:hypothetical protein